MHVISCSNSRTLAESISAELAKEDSCALINHGLIENKITHFSANEQLVFFDDDLSNITDCLVVVSFFPNANDALIESLLTLDILKRSNKKINLFISYLGYSRQNRLLQPNASFGIKVLSRIINPLIKEAGVDKIFFLDLHAPSILEYFPNAYNITLEEFFFQEIKKNKTYTNQQNVIIISPDKGSEIRAKNLAALLDVPYIVLQKQRKENEIEMQMSSNINLSNKKCIIIDDIIDSGKTINKASALLRQFGALEVYAYCTYCFTSDLKTIQNFNLTKLYITDSIKNPVIDNHTSLHNIEKLDASSFISQKFKKLF